MPTFTDSDIYLIAGIISGALALGIVLLIYSMQVKYRQYQRAVWALLGPAGRQYYDEWEIKKHWGNGDSAESAARHMAWEAVHQQNRSTDMPAKESDLPEHLRKQAD